MSQANAGFHHLKVGDITVTALNDGLFEASTGYLLGIEPAEAEAALRAGCRAVPPMFTVNAFLIQTGTHVALVDTGAAKVMGRPWDCCRTGSRRSAWRRPRSTPCC